MYQPGETIKDTLNKIERCEIVLPAIQREMVWEPDQIYKLFDSLMQGYPFGTFLYWQIERENSAKFKYYGLVLNYHEKDAPHCPPLPVIFDRSLIGVLDGQQRLTALNIGLRGSMAWRLYRKKKTKAESYPQRRLHLDLLWQPNDDDEEGLKYRFKFLTEDELNEAENREGECWFRVGDILSMKDTGPSMTKWFIDHLSPLSPDRLHQAHIVLSRLYEIVQLKGLIVCYEEESQELDKVLQIFIRMNDGGTPLSHSDMLLSIAVAQWRKHDAREEIHGLVDDLNRIGVGFSFDKNLVLKAGLMLSEIGSVGFKVDNFNSKNMEIFESKWYEIKRAMMLTVQLISHFGFNRQNLSAGNAILPIAYYLYRRSPSEGYLTQSRFDDDRREIREWLVHSLLKSGVWGSGLDTLLTALRRVIGENSGGSFPASGIRTEMAGRGRTLVFEPEEMDDLVDMQYGDRRLFALLSLLFVEFVDLRNHFHIDHIFPKSHFTRPRLMKAGVSEDEVDNFISYKDGLANLQLLGGQENNEKRAKMPADWLAAKYSDPKSRQNYEDCHMLGDVPDSIVDFGDFYETRRARLRERIEELLGRQARR